MFNLWLHIVALITYLGAVVGLGIILLPSLSSIESHEEKVHFLARGLKFYNPLQVGALGLVLFSGAFELTHLKAIYREMFLKQLGYNLGIKLTFAFLLVFFSVYQAMGIGHRFVKRHELGERVTPDELATVTRRLKGANWFILVLAVITLWFGLRLQS
jgi:uncharacterized membrane protein